MDPLAAAQIVALRPSLEELVVKTTNNPEGVSEPEALDADLMGLIRNLSKPSAGKFGLKMEETEVG